MMRTAKSEEHFVEAWQALVDADVNRHVRRKIREVATGKSNRIPIQVIDGDAPPSIIGEAPQHKPSGGYRSGWIYKPSTKRYAVSTGWLETTYGKQAAFVFILTKQISKLVDIDIETKTKE